MYARCDRLRPGLGNSSYLPRWSSSNGVGRRAPVSSQWSVAVADVMTGAQPTQAALLAQNKNVF